MRRRFVLAATIIGVAALVFLGLHSGRGNFPAARASITTVGDGHRRVMRPIGSDDRVTLLHFGVVGDSRPARCDDTDGYPSEIVRSIAEHLQHRRAQFAIDLGDHMYVCSGGFAEATAQMDRFLGATEPFQEPWLMTLGNHECGDELCPLDSTDGNFRAFMAALAPISKTPYYAFNVRTSHGLATFVDIADNSWDENQAAWLERTLTQSDREARYTVVIRHHPDDDNPVRQANPSIAIVHRHKFALLLSGHGHLYRHPDRDGGRVLVLGTGGAPLTDPSAFFGYALIDELPSGNLEVSLHDLLSDEPRDRFFVGPNG